MLSFRMCASLLFSSAQLVADVGRRRCAAAAATATGEQLPHRGGRAALPLPGVCGCVSTRALPSHRPLPALREATGRSRRLTLKRRLKGLYAVAWPLACTGEHTRSTPAAQTEQSSRRSRRRRQERCRHSRGGFHCVELFRVCPRGADELGIGLRMYIHPSPRFVPLKPCWARRAGRG